MITVPIMRTDTAVSYRHDKRKGCTCTIQVEDNSPYQKSYLGKQNSTKTALEIGTCTGGGLQQC